MDRRTYIARSGVVLAGSAALAGCTEETLEAAETNPTFLDHVDEEEVDLPVEQRLDLVEAGVLTAASTDIRELEDFEAFLADNDLQVDELDDGEAVIEEKLEIESETVDVVREESYGEGVVLELGYHQPDLVARGTLRGVGVAAGGYAALVDAGFDGVLFEATLLDAEREAFGTFHVLTEWAREFNDGVTSARVYGAKAWTTAASG